MSSSRIPNAEVTESSNSPWPVRDIAKWPQGKSARPGPTTTYIHTPLLTHPQQSRKPHNGAPQPPVRSVNPLGGQHDGNNNPEHPHTVALLKILVRQRQRKSRGSAANHPGRMGQLPRPHAAAGQAHRRIPRLPRRRGRPAVLLLRDCRQLCTYKAPPPTEIGGWECLV
jgi:hypothetical protein